MCFLKKKQEGQAGESEIDDPLRRSGEGPG